jgi:hypothetical protein
MRFVDGNFVRYFFLAGGLFVFGVISLGLAVACFREEENATKSETVSRKPVLSTVSHSKSCLIVEHSTLSVFAKIK